MKILVVDDDESFCRFIEMHAKARSIRVHSVHSLQSGIKAFEEEKFQAFIIDGYLPDGEGLELVRKIREKDQEIPIGFVSVGYSDSESFKKLKSEFAIDFVVTKPIDEGDLQKLLELLVKGKVKEIKPEKKDDVFKDLHEDYIKTIPEKIRLVESLIHQFQLASTETHLNNLKRTLHKIAGSAGSYGFMEVTNLCRSMEENLKEKLERFKETKNYDQWHEEFLEFFRRYKMAFQIREETTKEEAPLPKPSPEPRDKSQKIQLYLVDDDPELLTIIENEGKKRGFDIIVDVDADHAEKKLQDPQFEPDILLMDLDLGGKNGFDLLRIFKEAHKKEVKTKLGIMSLHREVPKRAEAVKLGVELYYSKPVHPEKLFSSLEEALRTDISGKFKVLMVDDDNDFCQFVVPALQPLECEMKCLNSGIDLMNTIETFKPDILFLDINMPELSGIELLKMVRADFRFRTLPVIMITVAGDEEHLQEAYSLGILDFIHKPVSENLLRIRVENMLKMHFSEASLKDRDRLTGLYQKQVVMDLFHLVITQHHFASVTLLQLCGFDDDHDRTQGMREVGELLGSFFHQGELIGVWSDEQFLLVLPSFKLGQTRHLLNEIVGGVKGLPRFQEKDKRYLASGAVAYPEHGKDLGELVRMAQERVDFAMREGPWRISVASQIDVDDTDRLRGKRVVIVGDDQDVCQIIEQAMKGKGLETFVFPDGESSLEWLEKHIFDSPPHLVVLDWVLSGMSSMEVLIKIKEMFGESVPVIVLSALTQEHNMLQALRKGASEYLNKPFSIHVLMEKTLELIQ